MRGRIFACAVLLLSACGQSDPTSVISSDVSGAADSAASITASVPTSLAPTESPTSPAATSEHPSIAAVYPANALWSTFPASADPRPVVLPQGPIIEPSDGYPDDGSKEAIIAGAINPPTDLPASPGDVDGRPIISAIDALAILRRGNGQTAAPITASTVTLGTADFATDRGVAKLPAWLFRFPDFSQPVAVIALAAPALFDADGVGPHDSSLTAHIDPSGTNVTVTFAGAAAGDGACTADYHLSLVEHETYVDAFVPMTRSTDGVCSAVAYRREETAPLERPLAGRVLVDASTGAAVIVDSA